MIIWNAQQFEKNEKTYTRHLANMGAFTLLVAPVVNDEKEGEVMGYVFRIVGISSPTEWLGSMPTAEEAKSQVLDYFVTVLTSSLLNIDESMLDDILVRQKKWLTEGKQAAETARAVTHTAVQGRVAEIAKQLAVQPDELAKVMGIKFPEEVPEGKESDHVQ